jgi:hypothetical protein
MINVISQLLGWCTVEKAKRLFDLIKESDSQFSVELGVFGGRSLIPMALAHKDKRSGFIIGFDAWTLKVAGAGIDEPAHIDYWNNVNFKDVYNKCQEGIARNGVEDFCDTVRMVSQKAAPLFADNSIDLLHQDSNHDSETILQEIKLWSPKVKVGGYWVADDVDWKEAVEGYSHLKEYGFELLENHTTWQIWKKAK